MLRATSSDGVTWTKDRDFVLTPEGDARYRWPGEFRDGFVFWNPERKGYGMLVTATAVNDRRENTFGIWSDTVGSESSNVMLQSSDGAR